LKEPQVISQLAVQHSLFIALCLIAMPILAIDTGTLDVGAITGEGWKLEGVNVEAIGLNQKKPQFSLSATKLTLPKPFHDLKLANVRCNDFTWDKAELHCNQGRVSVRSAYWQSPSSAFSFHFGTKQNTFKLTDVRLAGSRLSFEVQTMGPDWHCKLDAKQVSNALVDKLFQAHKTKAKAKLAQAKPGYLNLSGTISGRQQAVQKFDMQAEVEGLTDQAEDGKIATEHLQFTTHLAGKHTQKGNWFWHSDSKLLGGALYVDPVYLEAGKQPITLAAQGTWNGNSKLVEVQAFTYQHPAAGTLTGSANGYYRDGIKLNKADVALTSNALQGLLVTYINPFLTESPFTGMSVAGDVNATFTFNRHNLTATAVQFSNLNVRDEAGRVAIKGGKGSVNWSQNPLLTKQTELTWERLAIKGLPLESASLRFTSQANHFILADKVNLPFLNGAITVDQFRWRGNEQGEPDVAFAGALANVSLEQLSKVLGWTPLVGNISGQIPGVVYHDKTLKLDGELSMHVFDGAIKVNNLAASGLFGDFPQVSGDVAIDNLDLDQLTQKFEFGNITGRLSGNVNKLVLENWRPVTFFAWLGTPDDDDSSHKISQKAVKNIASIGGGGASDLVSRSLLGFFETFGYDKIGIGCYLHNGVCQMMGLEAAGQGYYLIKGGGLPRIDVLGYNPQVNWDVLVERLGRVVSPDTSAIIN
jgi:hypothetical protein